MTIRTLLSLRGEGDGIVIGRDYTRGRRQWSMGHMYENGSWYPMFAGSAVLRDRA